MLNLVEGFLQIKILDWVLNASLYAADYVQTERRRINDRNIALVDKIHLDGSTNSSASREIGIVSSFNEPPESQRSQGYCVPTLHVI